MQTEPTRQIHLDFHTSGLLTGIGSAFRKKQFQEALTLGRVNLINVFAKCHHSWSYYPTKIGRPHPHLTCDLLGGQLEACREIGVRAPIYVTMGWSAQDAEDHPDWCMRHADGTIVGAWDAAVRPEVAKPVFQWKCLCPTGEYHQLIVAQTEEICRLYPVDGFWYDIYQAERLCYCERCRRAMRDAGLNPERQDDVERQRAETIRRHTAELKALVHGRHPQASIYFNGLTVLGRPANARYRLFADNTKNDLEDLPTTWGGYDKFPLRAKFFHREGKPIVAMSGKFHTSWGEFGGFKDPEAIRYEAAAMIAFGASCNIGDQLHPCGEMDLETYASIGHAYRYVEQIESYGVGGTPVASLGVWLSHAQEEDEGLARMLMEEQIDFDVVRGGAEFSAFEVVVVPSHAGTLAGVADDVAAYVAGGGRLLVLGDGALTPAGDRFLVDVGADFAGPRRTDIDYTVVGDALATGVVRSPFLNYEAAVRARPRAGTEVLARVREPFFSRTHGAYCGHQNTPYRPAAAEHAAAVRHGRVVWLAHGLDRSYYRHGAKLHRRLVANALRLLHREPMAEAALPSAGRISLLHQPAQRRYVLHLLYGTPLQRGRCLVIEDLVPLYNTAVTLRLPVEVTSLRLVPSDTPLAPVRTHGALTVVVPEFSCHCAIVAEY